MSGVEKATKEELHAWTEISSILLRAGYKEGHEAGYSEGINTYTFKRRFFYKSFEYTLGVVMGVIVSFILGIPFGLF